MKVARMDIITRRRQRIAAVPFTNITVIKVESGAKRVSDGSEHVEVTSGGYLAVVPGQLLNLENVPNPNSGYHAVCLALADSRPETSPARDQPANSWTTLDPTLGLIQAFAHTARGAADAIEEELIRYRAAELLAATARSGFRPPVPRERGATDYLRLLFAEHPAHGWRADEVAARLGMSSATLRRRLANEKTGFQQLLRDVRLAHALALVQSSTLPLKAIAAECGYDSTSHFSARFRERFGCAPSALRD